MGEFRNGACQNTLGTALSENPIHDGKEDNIRIKNIDVFQSDDKKRMLVVSHEDGREIADESGFDLLDKANNSAAQYPHADHETTEGFSNSKDDGTPGLAELPSLVVIDETEPADISVSAVTVDFKVEAKAPDKDHMVPSNEESDNEKKMREQIDAIKKIIGYKGAARESCKEELNALYSFVGVEPSSSLKEPSDLNEVNEKLQFLMSIVGVK